MLNCNLRGVGAGEDGEPAEAGGCRRPGPRQDGEPCQDFGEGKVS